MTRQHDSHSPQPQGSTAKRHGFRPRSLWTYAAYLMLTMLTLAGVGLAALYIASLDESAPSSASSNVAASAPTGTTVRTAAPQATQPPPPEPSQEVELQQQLRDWLVSTTGVTNVLSLDIDVPAGEAPLVYAEIEVSPGYNNTGIPEIFAARLNEALDVTQYSDLVVIIDDGVQTVEYTFDPEARAWNETLLDSHPLSVSQSREE